RPESNEGVAWACTHARGIFAKDTGMSTCPCHPINSFLSRKSMPDHRCHRGMHPEDQKLFAADQWPALRCAVTELSWLLSHGYAEPSALKIVGDRHALDARQRMAEKRCACTDAALAHRNA